MKKIKKLLLAGGLIVGLTISARANVPPPPVNQNIGIPDTVFGQLAEDECRFCHRNDGTAPDGIPVQTTYLPDRHHLKIGQAVSDPTAAPNPTVGAGIYECLTCHSQTWDPVGLQWVFVPFRQCNLCHVQNVNNPYSVHHLTSKAQAGECTACHGFIVDLLTPANERSPIPTYPGSLVTPWPGDKPNGDLNDSDPTSAPGMAGNCDYCHNNQDNTLPSLIGGVAEATSGYLVYRNTETHHSTGFGTDGSKCNWCHNPFADPDIEPRIRACQNCHDIGTLHNIQVDSNGDSEITPGLEVAYYGHIGAQKDCWGCHGFVSTLAAPETGPTIPALYGVDATSDLVENQPVTLTINGASLVNKVENPMTGAFDITIESSLAITDDAGNTTEYTPTSITENAMTVDVTLAAGNYEVRAVKGRYESNSIVITVADATGINYAVCRGNTITIKGEGFSLYSEALNPETGQPATSLTARSRTGAVDCGNIISWTDSKITAVCTACPDDVIVNSIWNEAVKRARKIRRRR